MELHRSNQSMKHEIVECSNPSNNMKGLLSMRQQRHELSDCMNLNNSGVATVLNGTHQVPINCITSPHNNSQSSAATISPSSSSNGAAATKMGSRRIFTPQFKLQVLDSYRSDNDCKGNQRATARKYGIHRRQIQKWLQCETNLRTSVLNSNNNNNKNMLQNMLCNSAPAQPPSNVESLKPSALPSPKHPYGGAQQSPCGGGEAYMLTPLDGNNAINANSPKPATPLIEYLHRYPSGVAAGNSQCSTTGFATTSYPALVHTVEHAPVSHHMQTLEATATAFSSCATNSSSTSLSCSPRHDHSGGVFATIGGGCMRQEDSDNTRLTTSRGVDYCGTHNRCGNLYLYENPIDLTLKWRKRSELDDARIPTPHCAWQSHHHRHNVCAIIHEMPTVGVAATPPADPNVLDLSCHKRKADEMTPDRSLCGTRKQQPLQLVINDNNNLAPKPVKLFKPYLPCNGDEDTDDEEQGDSSKKSLSKNDQRDPIIWSNHPSCGCVGGDATAMHFNELTSPLSQTSYSSLSPPLSSYPMSDSGASSMNGWSGCGSSWSASSSSSSSYSSAYGSGCESSDASPPPSPYLNCQYSVMFKLQAIDTYYTDVVCRGDERAVADKFNVQRREIEEWLSQEEDLRQRLVVQL